MKKLCSLLLAVAMLATVVFCPTAGVLTSAETTTASTEKWSITNTYDDDGVYYLTSASDGENGNWRRKNNETDTFYSGTSIESDRIKDAVFAKGIMATDDTQDRYYTFPKAYVADYTSTPNYIAVYDSNAEDKAMYTPEKGTTYAISFKYKSTVAKSASSLLLNVYGLTSTTESVGTAKEMLNTVLTVPKTVTVTEWATATGYFIVEKDYEGLVLSLVSTATDETTVASGTAAAVTIDDVVLTKIENDTFINTYDDAGISYFTSSTADNKYGNWRRRISSTTAAFGSGTSPDSGKIVNAVFARGIIAKETAQGNYVTFTKAFVDSYTGTPDYVALYDSFASDRTMKSPDKNVTYKIKLKYKSTVSKNASALKLKVYGLTSTTGAIGTSKEELGTVITVPKQTTVTEWTEAEAYFTVGNTDYNGLLLSLISTAIDDTTVKSGTSASFMIDDISVTKLEYGAVINNYDDEGVYYTTSSSEEDNYGNWRRKTNASDTFYAGTSIDGTSIREAVFAKGIMSKSGFDQSRGYSFKKAYRTDYTGTPDFVSIYDSFDSDRSMYIPENNVTYKIRFKYKSETVKYASALHLNMYGLTSTTESIGTSKELLNTLLIIPKNTTVTEWTEAVGYFTVENDYNGLLLSLVTTATDETTVASGTTAKFSIDDIVITKMGSFAIDNAAVKGEQTDGFAPLDSTETALFTVNAGDSIKLDYKMSNTATGVKLAVQFFADEPSVIDYGIGGEIVDLFELTETNASSVTYNTTITAPISGYAVVIAYTDGEAVTDAGILVEDFDAQVYTPDLLKGDTNLDGALDLKDLVNTKKAIAMNYRLGGDYMVNSDLDKTGNIAAGDLVVIRQLLLGTYDNTDTLAIDLAYDFANETAGSAEGTITLTSKEAVDNYIDLYWGADGKPIADCYYIGSTAISAGSTAEIAMDARLAIPDGATQIILSDGLDNAIFDIPESKLADGSFSPYSISLVKDYTVGENIANVSVVYPATAESNTYNIACEFRNELTDILGAEVEFIADTETLDSNSYYILLGKTSVNESATALNEIITDRADYNGDYIIRETNKKIVVTADNDYALQLAIDDFFSNYCTSDESLITAGMNYKSSQYNELGSITIAGTSIENYTVVYPETASILEVDAADYLVSNVLKKTGKLLNVTNDTAEAGSYEILIGNTNRTNEEYATTAAGNVDNSYSISVGANATSIVGSSNSATNAGVIDFTARILKGAVSEGTYTGSYDGSYSLTNGYKLTWSDEFSGTELSDTWGFCDTDDYDTVKGGKTEFLMENATVSGGTLKATSYMDGNDSKGLGIYTRGTNSKYFKYGYFEARIKLSDIQGFTTSFWMTTIGKKMGDLTCYGEFDILEMYTTNNTVHPNLHNHSTAENHKNYLQGTGALKPSISTTDPLGEKFHNFGMEWTDDYIYFYLDGVRYFSFDCTLLPEYVVFDQLASISMTFNAGLYVEPTVDSSVAYVDWVRVWQKDEAGYVIK